MSESSENRKLRFVILFHEFPVEDPRESHWDLMLEENGGLLTWRLAECPDRLSLAANPPIACEPLAIHRIAYLDYEGPVSGGRGSVSRTMQGTYERISECRLDPSKQKFILREERYDANSFRIEILNEREIRIFQLE